MVVVTWYILVGEEVDDDVILVMLEEHDQGWIHRCPHLTRPTPAYCTVTLPCSGIILIVFIFSYEIFFLLCCNKWNVLVFNHNFSFYLCTAFYSYFFSLMLFNFANRYSLCSVCCSVLQTCKCEWVCSGKFKKKNNIGIWWECAFDSVTWNQISFCASKCGPWQSFLVLW